MRKWGGADQGTGAAKEPVIGAKFNFGGVRGTPEKVIWEGFMLSQTAPSGGMFDSDLFADQAVDGPGNKHPRAQGGRLAIRLSRSDLALVDAEQVKGEEHRGKADSGPKNSRTQKPPADRSFLCSSTRCSIQARPI